MGGFFDWLGEQGSRLGYQASRAGNAVQGMWGGGVQNYDPSGLNWAGVQAVPGETGMGDFGNTLGRVGGDAAAGAAIGSFIPGVGTAIGGLAGGAYGLAQSFFDDPYRAQREQMQATAAQPVTTAAAPSSNPSAPSIDIRNPGAPLTVDQAAGAAADQTQVQKNRQSNIYDQASAVRNPYTDPANQATFNRLYSAAYAAPMFAGAGAAHDAMSDQINGQMGGYGSAASQSIMADAGGRARDAEAAMRYQMLQGGAAWDQQHLNQMQGINTSDPTMNNLQGIWGPTQAQQNWQKQFDQGIASQQAAGYGQLVGGVLGAAGGALSNPQLTGAATSFFASKPAAPGGGQPAPMPAPVQYPSPNQVAAAPPMPGQPGMYGSFQRNASGGRA